jgi:hypothetical protein
MFLWIVGAGVAVGLLDVISLPCVAYCTGRGWSGLQTKEVADLYVFEWKLFALTPKIVEATLYTRWFEEGAKHRSVPHGCGAPGCVPKGYEKQSWGAL